jgi:hypothetical protein
MQLVTSGKLLVGAGCRCLFPFAGVDEIIPIRDLVVDGQPVWQYEFRSSCSGRPADASPSRQRLDKFAQCSLLDGS